MIQELRHINWIKFEKWSTTSFQTTILNRTLKYLRHNFAWDRLISRQTDNPWPSYSQDLNPPDYSLRGYLKESVCENNQQTVDIIRKEIRRIAQEMLNRVKGNLIGWVAAHTAAQCMKRTLYYLLKKYSKTLLILEWFIPKEFYKLPASDEKKSWRFSYFCKRYCRRKIGTFLWAFLYKAEIRKTINALRLTQKHNILFKKHVRFFLLHQHLQIFWYGSKLTNKYCKPWVGEYNLLRGWFAKAWAQKPTYVILFRFHF